MFGKTLLENFSAFAVKISVLVNLYSKLPDDIIELKKCRDLMRYILKDNRKNTFWLSARPRHLLRLLSDIAEDQNVDAMTLKNLWFYRRGMYQVASDYITKIIHENYKKHDCPKILIVSHEFSLTGAPKAALMLTKTIRNIYGVAPVVMTMKDGEIRKEFENEDILFFEYDMLPHHAQYKKDLLNQFDLIIVNSWAWEFMSEINDYELKIPVMWWSHEVFERAADLDFIKEFIASIDLCLGGSPLTMDVFKKKFPEKKREMLLYGLPEVDVPCQKSDKIVFSIMGSITERKGQDIFIKAIRKIPQEYRQKAKFYIIGKELDDDGNFGKTVRDMARSMPEIEFVDELPFDQLLSYYGLSDVIVMPSRNDPMPIVATYGLMLSKLCVLSSGTGTSLLMENNVNGVIFENENDKALSAIMTDVIKNPDQYQSMANAGQKVFADNFSMQQFQEKVHEQINKLIRA